MASSVTAASVTLTALCRGLCKPRTNTGPFSHMLKSGSRGMRWHWRPLAGRKPPVAVVHFLRRLCCLLVRMHGSSIYQPGSSCNLYHYTAKWAPNFERKHEFSLAQSLFTRISYWVLTSLIIFALGSKLRYTRCPNPNSFSFLFFTPAINAGMFSTCVGDKGNLG